MVLAAQHNLTALRSPLGRLEIHVAGSDRVKRVARLGDALGNTAPHRCVAVP